MVGLWKCVEHVCTFASVCVCLTGVFSSVLSCCLLWSADLPDISVTHSNLTVMEGANVTVTCNGSGVPLPEVDWTVSGLQSINIHQVSCNACYATVCTVWATSGKIDVLSGS